MDLNEKNEDTTIFQNFSILINFINHFNEGRV